MDLTFCNHVSFITIHSRTIDGTIFLLETVNFWHKRFPFFTLLLWKLVKIIVYGQGTFYLFNFYSRKILRTIMRHEISNFINFTNNHLCRVQIPPFLWFCWSSKYFVHGVFRPHFYWRSLSHIAPLPESRAQIAVEVPHWRHGTCPPWWSAVWTSSSGCPWSRWPPPCSGPTWCSLGSLPWRWSSVVRALGNAALLWGRCLIIETLN